MLLLIAAALAVDPCVIVHARTRVPSFIVRRGMGADDVEVDIATVVVRHPGGLVLIDPAVSTRTREELAKAPFWLRVSLPELSKPLGPELAGQHVQAIAVTHLHWDHLSGALDFPFIAPRVYARELDWANTLDGDFAEGVPLALLRQLRVDQFLLEGPLARRDLLGDGSIEVVPLPGHTPGSVGYLVHARRDFFFIGDAAWELGQEKSRLGQGFADADAHASAQSAQRIENLRAAQPALMVVPAHDSRALAQLQACRF